MGTLCLSQALILRCESFTGIQNIALFIPTCVEVLVATTLIFQSWGSGWRHRLLSVEAWAYFSLALLELLSHVLPAVRDNLNVFRVVDIVLSALSFLPILLYTIFLCLFTCSEFLDGLPRRYRKFSKFMLILLIPIVLALTEAASFIGITHRVVNSAVAVGFSSQHNKTLWTILTNFDLGFLTGFQVLNFSFAFFRLAKAFIEKQRIESSSADEAHLFRGTGWITVGVKIGAVETVIGFVPTRFGVALARRILRTLTRASLVIGLFKGLDSSEDFQQVRDEILAGGKKRSFRGSRLRPLTISGPRLSTFRQLSPTANTFYNAGANQTSPENRDGARVTVHFNSQSGHAPTLEMRFSGLDMPNPAAIVESVKARPASDWIADGASRRSSYYANSIMTRSTAALPKPSLDAEAAPPPPPLPPAINDITNVFGHARGLSDFSSYSKTSGFRDSVNSMSPSVVKELTSQFPGLPPRVTSEAQRDRLRALQNIDTVLTSSQPSEPSLQRALSNPSTKTGLSASSSLRRKPAPRASVVLAPAPIDPFDEDATGVRIPTPLATSEHAYQMGIALSTNNTSTNFTQMTGESPASMMPSSSFFTTPTTARTEDAFKYDGSQASRVRSLAPSELPSVQESPHNRGKSMETLDISWLRRPGSEEYAEYTQEVTVERAMRKNVARSRSTSVPRIKSIGKAPRRYTPSPTKKSWTRGSVYIEPIVIPPKQYGGFENVELEQGSVGGSAPLRDSNVLGRQSYDRDSGR